MDVNLATAANGCALENKKVVVFQCMPCLGPVGRVAYSDGRRKALITLIRRVFGISFSNELEMEFDTFQETRL